jgi:8-amino-7-oxononanoate synthase
MDLTAYCEQVLQLLKTKNLYRTLRESSGRHSFSSNQYLGKRFGAGASRLMRASSNTLTAQLENELARWKGTPAALVFPTGYMANVGVISAVMGKGDLIILDKLCHASLIDGAYLSRADMRVFKHNTVADLTNILQTQKTKYKKILVITESVFSMDGDWAPLKELAALTREQGVWLMVDEAHAIGVFGDRGNGLLAALGIHDAEIITGTLSKAIGGLGGYVAGSVVLKEYLINRARSFIYTTALPTMVVKENLRNLKNMNNRLQKKLWNNIDYFYAQFCRDATSCIPTKLRIAKPQSAIIPIMIGDEGEALRRSQILEEKGFILPAIRYPTVPKGKARLRLTITAEHTRKEIDALIKALQS